MKPSCHQLRVLFPRVAIDVGGLQGTPQGNEAGASATLSCGGATELSAYAVLPSSRSRSSRSSALVHVADASAEPNWFYVDEWDFIAGRKAGDLGDVFRSHNGHWVTLPVLVFRVLYAAFGLRTYFPYRIVVIVLYLVAAALLLAVMRRAGVNPWIATAAASLFALFGAGWENIILPFQITFTGSLVFGLVVLLLADHDGDVRPSRLARLLAAGSAA